MQICISRKGVLNLPIGIDILMNLQTHQDPVRAHAHGDYTNRLPIQDIHNKAYANLHHNYKLESTLITNQRVPTD